MSGVVVTFPDHPFGGVPGGVEMSDQWVELAPDYDDQAADIDPAHDFDDVPAELDGEDR
jgi:hypothetical protein